MQMNIRQFLQVCFPLMVCLQFAIGCAGSGSRTLTPAPATGVTNWLRSTSFQSDSECEQLGWTTWAGCHLACMHWHTGTTKGTAEGNGHAAGRRSRLSSQRCSFCRGGPAVCEASARSAGREFRVRRRARVGSCCGAIRVGATCDWRMPGGPVDSSS